MQSYRLATQLGKGVDHAATQELRQGFGSTDVVRSFAVLRQIDE